MTKQTRTPERIVAEIQALTAVLNMRTTEIKFTQQGVGQKQQMVATGSFEYSPLSEKEVLFIKTALMSLAAQVDNGELVTFKKKEEVKTEETKEETNE